MKKSLVTILSLLGLLAVMGIYPRLARAWGPDERLVCGVNASEEIYCSTVNGLEKGEWVKVNGRLKQVIVRGGSLYGVNGKGEIYYAPDMNGPDTSWIRMDGNAKEISEGHGVLCVVNNDDKIYCADKGITTAHPQWRKSPHGSRLNFISVN